MESFLKHLENNYDTFNMFDGNLDSFKFPEDVMTVLTIIMKKTNEFYVMKCRSLNVLPEDISNYLLLKDVDGNCYLKVTGADKRTTLIIRQDNSDFHAYKGMVGRKITESEFLEILDIYQREKLARADIPKRFKENVPDINARKEMNTKSLIEYYEYLKDYYLESITSKKVFLEPDKKVQTRSGYKSRNLDNEITRKNDIISYSLRQKELLKYNPFVIYNFIGSKEGEEIDVYVYEREGFILAVAEPKSGESYTKILNLGYIDKTNTDLISENIKAALQASEDVVLMDDAIIRKGHTTLEVFKKNLEVLLDESDEFKRFSDDIESSKSVYRK